MTPFAVRLSPPLKGSIALPGDKSIAHRAVILSALSRGKTIIRNFPFNQDCLQTVSALRQLGLQISCDKKNNTLCVVSRGLYPPKGRIFTGESGTTIRLLAGVAAGQPFETVFEAGKSLSRRPMLRVTAPLRLMGACIRARQKAHKGRKEEYPPLLIRGGALKGIRYRLPVASAQVKSSMLLAGLFAKGTTCVIEPIKTRDHTERMLKVFKARLSVKGARVSLKGPQSLKTPGLVNVPGDFSSASFFIAAALLVKGSALVIRDVGLNPSRIGALRVLQRMGAQITGKVSRGHAGEPSGSLLVKSSSLRAVRIRAEEIPYLIDELPVLMVAAACARGRSVFEGIQELRVKETDRIRSMSENLKKMGVGVRLVRTRGSEKMIITGAKALRGARVRSFGDHRTAMSMVIAGMVASNTTVIDDIGCIRKSFPGFLQKLKSCQAR